jgi:hypothetical protein
LTIWLIWTFSFCLGWSSVILISSSVLMSSLTYSSSSIVLNFIFKFLINRSGLTSFCFFSDSTSIIWQFLIDFEFLNFLSVWLWYFRGSWF